MRTDLINDLKDLAQKILQLSDDTDAENLRQNAHEIY